MCSIKMKNKSNNFQNTIFKGNEKKYKETKLITNL